MAKPLKILSFDEFAEELITENQPRALVILASSQIDLQLKNIIELYLLPKLAKATEEDELLEGDKPLSTFSSRIKLCYRLGLIDTQICGALNQLRTIRNNAAHWIVFGINEAPLKDNIKTLKSMVINRKSYQLTIKKYFGTEKLDDFLALKAMLLTLCVLVASIETIVPKKSLRNNNQTILD